MLKAIFLGIIDWLRSQLWPYINTKYVLEIPLHYMSMKGLPETTSEFSPFLIDNGNEHTWSRTKDWIRFRAKMKLNVRAHTILTGPSGSGKSTFIDRHVKPRISEQQLIFVNSYFKPIQHLLLKLPTPIASELRPNLEDKIEAFFARPIELTISQVFQDPSKFSVHDELETIGNEVTSYVQAALNGRPTTYFVFDQMERFLTEVKHLHSNPNQSIKAASVYIVLQILKTLRELDNARTIFVVRADALFDTIDFLSYSLDRLKDADTRFQYFYFDGISITSAPKAIDDIIQRYDPGLPVDWARFSKFNSLNSKSMSNTFLTQLTGYMLENFGESDHRVVKTILNRRKSPSDLLPLFFDHLIAGFHQSPKGLINHHLFKAVVVTIALENHCGEAITRQRISRLSHIPKSYVTCVVDYLLSRNVLKPDKHLGEQHLRFSHDLLFNFIVEAPQFQGRDDLHKGIERLAEHRVATEDLIKVSSYGNFPQELRDGRFPAYAMLAYWLFASTLVISSSLQLIPLPEGYAALQPWLNATCNTLFNAYNALLNCVFYLLPILRPLFSVTDCSAIGHYSVAIAIMHSVWLWYIYKLDRGYFRYVFRNSPPCRKLSAWLVPLGAILGILVGFSPNLCVVPITAIGFGMAALLICAACQNNRKSAFGKSNSDWGTRTAVNMFLTTLLMVNLHSFMLSPLPAYTDARQALGSEMVFFFASPANTIFWGTSIFLVWFWWHVRPMHQSAISMAARLTQFDVARNLQPSQPDAEEVE